MKNLAAFVMRGRWQALLVAVAGSGSLLFCWISAAVVALVTLRKGAGQGAWLLFWALLPSGTLLYVFGDSGPLTLLLGVMALALVLRGTVSLPLSVLASVPVGILTGLGLLFFADQFLDQMVAYFGDFLASVEQQMSQAGDAVVLARPNRLQIAGMLGAGTALGSAVCLLLARYWQSALYNPGGFGSEFRALYYPPLVAVGLALAAAALAGLGLQYRSWALICLLPLMFAGLGLVHARAVQQGRGRTWLTGFYLALLVFDPLKLLLVLLAITDSWFNFRRRWQANAAAKVIRRDSEED